MAPRRLERERLQERPCIFAHISVLFGRQNQGWRLAIFDHQFELRLHTDQSIPTNFFIENIQSVTTIVIG